MGLSTGGPFDPGLTPQEEHQAGDGAPGDGELLAIQFQRGYRGFGFSIRGGREFDNMALFVLRIAENGPAALDGRLRVRRLSTSGIRMISGVFCLACECWSPSQISIEWTRL